MSHKEDFLNQCLILDTETTGKDYKTAEIIESGFVIREANDWTIFQELHRPLDGEIPAQVQAICYITNTMVADKPSFIDSKDTFEAVAEGFKERDGYFVAHNHFYDMRVLQNHGVDLSDANWICTWRMVKKLFQTVPEIEETSLPYLRFKLELDVPIEMYCHRAGNDSYMTGKLLETLIDYMEGLGLLNKDEPYGPQIHAWAAAPIIYQVMPFGKHKGVAMKDVPVDYWRWAMKNTDWFNEEADNYDPDLAESIALVLE